MPQFMVAFLIEAVDDEDVENFVKRSRQAAPELKVAVKNVTVYLAHVGRKLKNRAPKTRKQR